MKRIAGGLFVLYKALFLTLHAQSILPDQSKADSLLRNGRAAAAIPIFKSLQEQYEQQANWQQALYCAVQGATACQALAWLDEGEAFCRSGVRMAEEGRATDPMLLARLYRGKGILLNMAGRYEESEADSRVALQYLDKVSPPNPELVASVYNNLAVSYAYRRRLALAGESVNKALQQFEQNRSIANTEQARTYINMGLFSSELLDNSKALEYLHKVEAWYDARKGKINPSPFLYATLGLVYQRVGDYERAATFHTKAFALTQTNFAVNKFSAVSAYINLAALHNELEEWPKAIAVATEGLSVADSVWRQKAHIFRAYLYIELANAYAGSRQHPLAVKAWQNAIQEVKDSNVKNVMPQVYVKFAQYHKKNKDYATALLYNQNALAIAEELKLNDVALSAEACFQIGDIYCMQERYETSLGWFDRSLQSQMSDPSQMDADGLPRRQYLAKTDLAFAALMGKAQAWSAMSQKTPDPRPLLEKAMKACDAGLIVGDLFRTICHDSRQIYQKWMARYWEAHAQGLDVSYQLYRQTGEKQWLQTAFNWCDRSKSVQILEGVQGANATSFAGVPTEVVQEETYYNRQIGQHEYLIAGASSEERKSIETKLSKLRQEYDAFIRKTEVSYPRYFSAKHHVTDLSVASFQASLSPQTLMIEYFHDLQRRRLYIFTVSAQDGLRMYLHSLDDRVENDIRELSDLVKSVYLSRAESRTKMIELCYRLYGRYMLPIEAELAGKNKLIVIGEGSTNYLPFELLLDNPGERPFHELPFLIRRFEISYHYSSVLYTYSLKSEQTRKNSDLLVFAPLFENAAAPETLAQASLQAIDAGGKFSPLPYSKAEAQNILETFGPNQATALIGAQATETALKTELQKPYKIAHIASHSFVNLAQPKFSGVACSPADRDRNDDGLLYAAEIYNMNIPTDLVVLSSGESGVGKISAGEGMLGLNRAFAYAGVPNIIYSLWKVNDKAGSDLMTGFYRGIKAGRSYASALREVKMTMLGNPATASPNLWGGFLLLGL